MDSLCEEETNGSVFGSGPARIRSPSLPVVSATGAPPGGGIGRSRSPSLPAEAAGKSVAQLQQHEARPYSPSSTRRSYTDRSDSGISDCSNHSSSLAMTCMPTRIQEEDDDEITALLTNGSVSSPLGGSSRKAADCGSGLAGGGPDQGLNRLVKAE